MTATTIFTIPAGETFQSFAQLNNILIVITDLNRYFLLYDVDTGTYSELEEIPMPLMDFQSEIIYSNILTASNLIDTTNYPFTGYNATYVKQGQETCVEQYLGQLSDYEDQGLVNGLFLISHAYKLFDGSYIKHSQPYLVKVDSGTIELQAIIYHDNQLFGDQVTLSIKNISVGKIKLAWKFTSEEIATINKYKDIIVSMDFFITPRKDLYNWEDYFINDDGTIKWEYTQDNPETAYHHIQPPDNPTKDNIIDVFTYYKIDSMAIDTFIDDPQPTSLIELNLSDFKNLPSRETLPVDNFTHHKVWGAKNYNYNSRLHFGNVTTKFFKGFYPFKWRYDYDINSAETYVAKVYIRTDQGEKIVYKEFEAPYMEFHTADYYLDLVNILSYPDSRAYKIELLRVVSGGSNDGVYFGPTVAFAFNLKPHLFLNLAYYINPAGIENYASNVEIQYDGGGSFYKVTLDVADTDVENDLLNDPNRVQVSRLDNALVYEAANSYQVGNDDETIIGFGSVVEPLSDGQFGQFPLYIFTTAGNFVLSQGSGAILYSNILPLNKDVCNNPLSITDIGGGVVYSTEKGLMILSGRQITEISQFLKGEPREYLINDTTYQDYLNDQNFVQLLSDLSTVNFLTYLSGAIIGFDYVNKEIIVSNDTYTFSYVYNLESKSWHKITEVYSEFVKVIPKTYGYSSGILYDLTDEDYDYIETLIQTRPIKLDTLNHKSIERLVLRGYYDVKDLTYSALLIYGSVDGKSYKFLTGRSRQDDSTFQDILVKNTHSSFKYFILVFVGQLKDSSINFIEVSYSERFGNKLR